MTFGHHPTAIRETLRALRIKYPQQKTLGRFSSRAPTPRGGMFSRMNWPPPLPMPTVVVAEVARLDNWRPRNA